MNKYNKTFFLVLVGSFAVQLGACDNAKAEPISMECLAQKPKAVIMTPGQRITWNLAACVQTQVGLKLHEARQEIESFNKLEPAERMLAEMRVRHLLSIVKEPLFALSETARLLKNAELQCFVGRWHQKHTETYVELKSKLPGVR